MSCEEIINKMTRNVEFYRTGGITATGGEPMCQLDFLTELFSLAKSKGIHTCLDTSGIMFDETRLDEIDRLLDVCDLVMLDIKQVDNKKHVALTGKPNTNVLNFARHLNKRQKQMRVRYVLVPSLTDSKEDLVALGRFLNDFTNLEKIEVLPYHTLGKVKYQSLGIKYPLENIPEATEKETALAYDVITNEIYK